MANEFPFGETKNTPSFVLLLLVCEEDDMLLYQALVFT